MAPEALCFQFLWGWAERGERGRGQGCSGTCHTWLSLNNFGQIFWKLFPGHEFCHHLKVWVYSFLSKSFDICPLWLEYSLGRILLISWKFCLGKSLPLCPWLMKCISLGRDHKPCRKGNFSLQCKLDICLRWILIFLYQEFWQPPLVARNSSPVVTFGETFPQ